MVGAPIDLRAAATSHSVIRDNDAASHREAHRRRRWSRLMGTLLIVLVALALGFVTGHPFRLSSLVPHVNFENPAVMSLMLGGVLVLAMLGPILGSGRSPHVLYRPEELGMSLADVAGAGPTKDEVVRSLNLFLAHRTFETEMGGTVRRGLLFAGPPGTGKTYLAKAMAGSADVPFVFVSATAFQSMFYGATARKIRSYFRALRKVARNEGGAIGFIEEFDAIALSRAGMANGRGEGASGVVNELLVQMQSFDEPPPATRMRNWFVDRANNWLPAGRRLKRKVVAPPNILIIAASNRAADLDPALMRPGRFDRTITFDLPVRSERTQIAQYYLNKKSHDVSVTADEVARITSGHSPVELEHLLDEALISALRNGRRVMTWDDVEEARLTTLAGIARDGEYGTAERWRIAIHESGHALAALLLGKDVGVVSILKRGDSLGITTHENAEENNLMTRGDLEARIQISLGGMIAEELECGDISNGASSDLESATAHACAMVGAFGMSGSLVSFAAATDAFGANLTAKVLANPAAREAADALLNQSRANVIELFSSRRAALRRAAQTLLEHDQISGSEFAQIVAGVVTA